MDEIYYSKHMNKDFHLSYSLIRDLKLILDQSFKNDTSLSEIENLLLEVDFLMIAKNNKTNEPLGYILNKIYFGNILYFSGIGVVDSNSSMGIGRKLCQMAWKSCPTPYVMVTTQNPIAYSILCKAGFEVFPSYTNLAIPDEITHLTKRYIELKNLSFDYDKFCVFNKYDKCLLGTIPKSLSSSFDSWFLNKLNCDISRVSLNAVLVIGIPCEIKKEIT